MNSSASRTDPDPDAQAAFDGLIRAIQANDRETFLKGATDEMKQAVTPQVMNEINDDLAPHLKKGFQATYLR